MQTKNLSQNLLSLHGKLALAEVLRDRDLLFLGSILS